MPLIITPRQWTQRAELYHQLASLITAGVGLIDALGMLRNSPPGRTYRKPLTRLIDDLNQGATFADALSRLGAASFPTFDVALLHAGEKSGRLDECFRLLADYYNERARLGRQVLSNLVYPALVVHVAILVFPPQLLSRLVWEGDVGGFLWSKAVVLVPLYAAVFVLISLAQGRHGEWWRSWTERLLRPIPVVGAARSNLALARLSISLEGLLSAGVSIMEAWELAAVASGSPALRRTVFAWRPKVLGGQTPAEAVRESGRFPDLFTNLYSTGEVSGKLDDTLRRLYRYYQEEASRKLQAVAQWTPRLIYLIIVMAVAYYIVTFWTGYYSQIGETAF